MKSAYLITPRGLYRIERLIGLSNHKIGVICKSRTADAKAGTYMNLDILIIEDSQFL